jgi:hypothetical protein
MNLRMRALCGLCAGIAAGFFASFCQFSALTAPTNAAPTLATALACRAAQGFSIYLLV